MVDTEEGWYPEDYDYDLGPDYDELLILEDERLNYEAEQRVPPEDYS